MDWILQSERLGFRKICKNDFDDLCLILQDAEVMYAWEHAFSKDEVSQWIEKNLARYANEGFSYFALIEKSTERLIGVMGPLVENIDGASHIGIAYILNQLFWGKGYAIEGAKACVEYAFNQLNADKVIAEIRPNNDASRKVAEKLGMKIEGEFVKHYNGIDMPHLIYVLRK
ncbi:GNAT family N-acetyltransferase [Hydrogenoanaerobacterium sp.]|uniref:GNAT family N-acetyltransferase n=1 Tax=Hydrogenoanaerobacterium sp. TaxID=2953763 RepID=UPI002896CE69|nr:GNAT family N-acetyltransferase [Hydrogenoanaerobacterium sp.]